MRIVFHIRNDCFEGVSSFGGSSEKFGAEDADVGKEKAFTCQFGTGEDKAQMSVANTGTFWATDGEEFLSRSADGIAIILAKRSGQGLAVFS